MLAGLTAEYEPMRMTIESIPESEINIEKIKDKLLLRNSLKNNTLQEGNIGLYAKSQNQQRGRFPRRGNRGRNFGGRNSRQNSNSSKSMP